MREIARQRGVLLAAPAGARQKIGREKLMQGTTAPDYVTIGFEKIDGDLKFLIACLGEVLTGLGLADFARHLPWSGEVFDAARIDELPPQLGLVYSIAFQLLNMVEENTAAAMRGLRETSEGLTAERGLWGAQLATLKTAGFSPGEIAAQYEQLLSAGCGKG